MSTPTQAVTTAELRAVFNDTPSLRFLGYSFERALARRAPTGPIQPTLI